MSEENVEIVRRLFAFFERFGGHVEADEIADRLPDAALAEFFTPEAEWVPVPQGLLAGSKYEGYEGIRRFWADFYAAWDELRTEPHEFLEVGDQVVVIARLRGRMHDLEIDEVWSGLCTLRDGRLIRVQGFASRDGALEAAGLREQAMSQENVALFRRIVEAFNDGDLDAIADRTTEDFEFTPYFAGLVETTTYHGRNGLREYMEGTGAAWENIQVRVDEIRDLGDCSRFWRDTWTGQEQRPGNQSSSEPVTGS